MNFLTYGVKGRPAILFIHGMATNGPLCYGPLLRYLDDHYVVLAEVDGHSEGLPEPEELRDNCLQIERYIDAELGGHVRCLSGFSMGGTMAVEIAGRGAVGIDKLHLDAAFLTKMGILTKPFEGIFCMGIDRLKRGKGIPGFLMDAVMGRDNKSVVEMLYPGISSGTILKACEFVYRYDIPDGIGGFCGDVLFWHGENERYPAKSARLLKRYLPGMKVEVFPAMGHGQFLHEHPEGYARRLLGYLET